MDYPHIFEYEIGIQKIKYTGSQGLGCCPLHDDNNPSFSFNVETGLWTCFSGCGSGNLYQLAERLNMDNPRQYIEPSTIDSNNHRTVEYKPITAVKSHSDGIGQVEIMKKYEELKERYGKRVELGHKYKDKYVGKDDNGDTVFIYPNGIKVHKKYWIKEASSDTSNQIFMIDELVEHFDTDEPLYIFEGEKDALASPLQGISFSCGATSIPKEIKIIYVFDEIVIVYDNDETGSKGAEKLAKRIKTEHPKTIVKIAQWDMSLPNGYDVYDDGKSTGFAKVDEAIENAIEYEIPTPIELEGFTIMTGKEASNTTPKPTEWIIENILPKGFISCLAGTTGSKKSMWAIQLALSIANGEKHFCGNHIKSGSRKVLFIDTEIGKDELLRRYHKIKDKMDWKGDDNLTMMSKGGTTMDIWEKTEEKIQSYRPELVVIDSMYNATSVTDFSKSTGMSKVTDALSIIKDRFNVTILVIAHFNKGNDEQVTHIDRIQGSAVFKNSIEFQMCMVQTNIDDFNLFQVQKTRGVPFDRSYIGLKWDDFWFTTKGIIDDINPYLITEHKKRKWTFVLEDLPEKFDTKNWLNVFNSKFDLTERTGKTWLKEASKTQMVEKLAHGVYQKKLKLIDENEIDE